MRDITPKAYACGNMSPGRLAVFQTDDGRYVLRGPVVNTILEAEIVFDPNMVAAAIAPRGKAGATADAIVARYRDAIVERYPDAITDRRILAALRKLRDAIKAAVEAAAVNARAS